MRLFSTWFTMLNEYQQKSSTSITKEVSEMEAKLKEINKQMANIIHTQPLKVDFSRNPSRPV